MIENEKSSLIIKDYELKIMSLYE